jgi:hypothetical protein
VPRRKPPLAGLSFAGWQPLAPSGKARFTGTYRGLICTKTPNGYQEALTPDTTIKAVLTCLGAEPGIALGVIGLSIDERRATREALDDASGCLGFCFGREVREDRVGKGSSVEHSNPVLSRLCDGGSRVVDGG